MYFYYVFNVKYFYHVESMRINQKTQSIQIELMQLFKSYTFKVMHYKWNDM